MRQSLLRGDLNRQPDFNRYPKIKKDHPMNSGLFGWWMFNTPRGSGVVKDIVRGNDAVNANTDNTVGWVSTPFGTGFAFDGVNDTCEATTIGPALTLPLTLACTFRNTLPLSFNGVMGVHSGATNEGIRIGSDINNNLQLVFGGVAAYFTIAYTPQEWYRVVATISGDGGIGTLYLKKVNGGDIVSSSTTVGTHNGALAKVVMGSRGDGASDFLTGIIADSQVWTRVLSPAEVTSYLLTPYGDAINSRIYYPANNRNFALSVIAPFPPLPQFINSFQSLITM